MSQTTSDNPATHHIRREWERAGSPTSVADQRRFPEPGQPQDAAPQGGGGNRTLTQLMKAIDSVQVHNQHDLYEVLEAFRQLGSYVAVQAGCISSEIDHGARAMAKAESTLGVVGLGVRGRLRRVVRRVDSIANHFMSAAGDAIAARHEMEALLDEIHGAKKPKQAKGFTIDMT
jgi:hypothetical protein